MKVKCPKCKTEMKYPFKGCDECDWVAKGKYAKKAKGFNRTIMKL